MQIQATFVHKAELVQILPNACYEVNNALTLEPQKPRMRQKIKTNQYLPWSQMPKPKPSIVKLEPRLWEVAHYSMCSGPSPGVHLKTAHWMNRNSCGNFTIRWKAFWNSQQPSKGRLSTTEQFKLTDSDLQSLLKRESCYSYSQVQGWNAAPYLTSRTKPTGLFRPLWHCPW